MNGDNTRMTLASLGQKVTHLESVVLSPDTGLAAELRRLTRRIDALYAAALATFFASAIGAVTVIVATLRLHL